jgi:hypothetical protein
LENELNFEIINLMLVLSNESMQEPKEIENLNKKINVNQYTA